MSDQQMSNTGTVTVPRAACREDLEHLRCVNGCDDHPISIMAVCHPAAATFAMYDRATGCLALYCAACQSQVASFEVATRMKVM